MPNDPASPIFEDEPVDTTPWKGYRSAQAKKTGQMIVVISAGVMFLGQIFIPFLIIFPKVFSAQMKAARNMSMPSVEQSIFWQGRIWFPAASRRGTRLRSFQPGDETEPDSGIRIPMTDPYILASEDRLFLIASDAVGEFRDGQFTRVRARMQLYGMRQAFLYEGRPAVIESGFGGSNLSIWNGRNWKRERDFQLMLPEERMLLRKTIVIGEEFKVITAGEDLHLFVKVEGTVYHRKGLPPETVPEKNQPGNADRNSAPVRAPAPAANGWQAVAPAGDVWSVAIGDIWSVTIIDDRPALFAVTEGSPSTLTGFEYRNGQWQEFFTFDVGQAFDLGVCGLDQPGRFALLFSSYPGQMRVVVIENGQTLSDHRYGKGPFDQLGPIMQLSFVAGTIPLGLILILVVIVSWVMRKYRTADYLDGPRSVPFATLERRGIARLIDSLIWLLPFVPMYARMFELFKPEMVFDNPQKTLMAMITLFGWWAAGLAVWLLLLIVYSFTEGKWGRTPGKWLTGIRVVRIDLTYCGFWRALARNLLLMVDAMFNFLVGILLISLTDNRQRLGDMAAKTVVIRSVQNHS